MQVPHPAIRRQYGIVRTSVLTVGLEQWLLIGDGFEDIEIRIKQHTSVHLSSLEYDIDEIKYTIHLNW